jgi:predicted RNase H-like HicB family nuclease
MLLSGKIWKDGSYWLAEVATLDVISQGYTKHEALLMAADAVEALVDEREFKAKSLLDRSDSNQFFIETSDPKAIAALAIQRTRERHSMTIRDLASSMGSKNPNSVAPYERCKKIPSIEKWLELMAKAGPDEEVVLSVVPRKRLANG